MNGSDQNGALRIALRCVLLVGLIVLSIYLLSVASDPPVESADSPERVSDNGSEIAGPPRGAPTQHPGARETIEPEERPAGGLTTAAWLEMTGWCIDENGEPVVGATVDLAWGGGSGPGRWRNAATTKSGSAGEFVLRTRVKPDVEVRVTVVAEGFVTCSRVWSRWATPTGTLVVGHIRIERGCRVRGRVVDTTGRPRAGVLVLIGTNSAEFGLEFKAAGLIRARSDARGEFEMPQRLPRRRYPVHIKYAIPRTPLQQIDLETAPDMVTKEIVVWRIGEFPTIRGFVTDEHGTPIKDAVISTVPAHEGRYCPFYPLTDAEGRFVVVRHPETSADPVRIKATKEGYANAVAPGLSAWGATGLGLTLVANPTLHIVASAKSTGDPIGRFKAWVVPETPRHPFQYVYRLDVDAGGRASLDGLLPGRYRINIIPEDRKWCDSGFLPCRVFRSAGSDVQVALHEAVWRELRARFSDGQPVIGSKVELIVPSDENSLTVVSRLRGRDGWVGAADSYQEQQGITDEHGAMSLRGSPVIAYALRIDGAGHATKVLTGVTFRPGKNPQDALVVEVERGAAVLGEIHPVEVLHQLSQRGRGKPWVRLVGTQGGREARIPASSRGTAHVETDGEGAFRIDGIPTGSWRLELCWWQAIAGNMSGKSIPLANVADLRQGETRKVSVDVSKFVQARVSGRVFIDGKVAPHTSIALRGSLTGVTGQASRRWLVATKTDRAGMFRSVILPGRYEAWVMVDGLSIASGTMIDPAPGQELIADIVVETRQVTLLVRGVDGSPRSDVEIKVGRDAASSDSWGHSTSTGEVHRRTGGQALGVFVLPRRLHEPKAWREFRSAHPNVDFWGAHLRVGDIRAGSVPIRVEIQLPETLGYTH